MEKLHRTMNNLSNRTLSFLSFLFLFFSSLMPALCRDVVLGVLGCKTVASGQLSSYWVLSQYFDCRVHRNSTVQNTFLTHGMPSSLGAFLVSPHFDSSAADFVCSLFSSFPLSVRFFPLSPVHCSSLSLVALSYQARLRKDSSNVPCFLLISLIFSWFSSFCLPTELTKPL